MNTDVRRRIFVAIMASQVRARPVTQPVALAPPLERTYPTSLSLTLPTSGLALTLPTSELALTLPRPNSPSCHVRTRPHPAHVRARSPAISGLALTLPTSELALTLPTSELAVQDYAEAFTRVIKLGLKDQQEREIVRVLIHCCKQVRRRAVHAIRDGWTTPLTLALTWSCPRAAGA